MAVRRSILPVLIIILLAFNWTINAEDRCGSLSPHQICYLFSASSKTRPLAPFNVYLTLDLTDSACTAADSIGYNIVAANSDWQAGFLYPSSNNVGQLNCFHPSSPNLVFGLTGLSWDSDSGKWRISSYEGSAGHYLIANEAMGLYASDYIGSASIISSNAPTATSVATLQETPGLPSLCSLCDDSLAPGHVCYHLSMQDTTNTSPPIELYLTIDPTQPCQEGPGGYLVVNASGTYSGPISFIPGDIGFGGADNCYYPDLSSSSEGGYFDNNGLNFDSPSGSKQNLFLLGPNQPYAMFQRAGQYAVDPTACASPTMSSSQPTPTSPCHKCGTLGLSEGCYIFYAVQTTSSGPPVELYLTIDYTKPCGIDGGFKVVKASGKFSDSILYRSDDTYAQADNCYYLGGSSNEAVFDSSGFSFQNSLEVEQNLFWDGNSYRIFNDDETCKGAYRAVHHPCEAVGTRTSISTSATALPSSTACYTLHAFNLTDESELDLDLTVDSSKPCTSLDQSGSTIVAIKGSVDRGGVDFNSNEDLGHPDYCLLTSPSGSPYVDRAGIDFTTPNVAFRLFYSGDSNGGAYGLCTNITGTGQCIGGHDILHVYTEVNVLNVPCSRI